MNTWDEMSQNGFSIIDQQRKIAVKLIMGQNDALETVKEILINSYIDYQIYDLQNQRNQKVNQKRYVPLPFSTA